MRHKTKVFRIEPEARSRFERAAAELGVNEGELAGRILGEWARIVLAGQTPTIQPAAAPATPQAEPPPSDPHAWAERHPPRETLGRLL